MLLALAVVAHTGEQHVARVLGHLLRVVAVAYLVEGSVGGVVVLQFDDDGGLRAVLSRYEHQVGESLPRGILAMDMIVVAGLLEAKVASVDICSHLVFIYDLRIYYLQIY